MESTLEAGGRLPIAMLYPMISVNRISITELVTWAELHPANRKVIGTDSPWGVVRFLRRFSGMAVSKHVPLGRPLSYAAMAGHSNGNIKAKWNSTPMPATGTQHASVVSHRWNLRETVYTWAEKAHGSALHNMTETLTLVRPCWKAFAATPVDPTTTPPQLRNDQLFRQPTQTWTGKSTSKLHTQTASKTWPSDQPNNKQCNGHSDPENPQALLLFPAHSDSVSKRGYNM